MIKVRFDKKGFVEESQLLYGAPQYKELKDGNLGEWILTIIFVPTLGWFWYPFTALCSTTIKRTKK